MSADEFERLPEEWRDPALRRTLAELSRTQADMSGNMRQCLSDTSAAGAVMALNFDAIKTRWQATSFAFMGKSADALVVDGADYYLIEFKMTKAVIAEVIRKIYDSVLALVEHRILTWSECRERLSFVLVGPELKKRLSQICTVPSAEYLSDDYRQMNLDPRIPIGQVLRDVRILDISDFEAFVKDRNWH